MTEEEVSKLYARLAIQFDAMLATLLSKKLVLEEIIPDIRKEFYDSLNEEEVRTAKRIATYKEIIRSYIRDNWSIDLISLTQLAKEYSTGSPGYVIQSWMRSRNTLEFLHQWEIDMNTEFDDAACKKLIQKAHTTSLTITPSLWIRETRALGMAVKQGKGGGVKAYPEIAADFRLWLDPKTRLAIVRAREKEPESPIAKNVFPD